MKRIPPQTNTNEFRAGTQDDTPPPLGLIPAQSKLWSSAMKRLGTTICAAPWIAGVILCGWRLDAAEAVPGSALLAPGEPEPLIQKPAKQPANRQALRNGGALGVTADEADALINLDGFRAKYGTIDGRGYSVYGTIDGRGYSVVIIDTGCNTSHPFFGNRILKQLDFGDGDEDATDRNGHGTNVASIVGSSDSVYTGMAPGCNLIILKVFTDSGSATMSRVEHALRWVVDNAEQYKIAAVNMSISDRRNHESFPDGYRGVPGLLRDLKSRGVVVCAAAGNEFYPLSSVPGLGYPAADSNVLAIGAVFDKSGGLVATGSGAIAYSRVPGQICPFSQRLEGRLACMAPGHAITGAAKTGAGLATYTGTSQASPHVAGIAALMQQLAGREGLGQLNTDEFAYLLGRSSVEISDGDDENDNVANNGARYRRIDALALGDAVVAMAQGQYGLAHSVSLDRDRLVTDGGVGEGTGDVYHEVLFTVRRQGDTQKASTVDYAITGTAAIGIDYDNIELISEFSQTQRNAPASGTLSWAPHETVKTVSFRIRMDDIPEQDETLVLTLTNAIASDHSATTITNAAATLTLLNDDGVAAPTVSFTAAGQSAGEDEGFARVKVTLSAVSADSVTVPFTVSGTAGAGDYTSIKSPLSIPPGALSGEIKVGIKNDSVVDPGETVILTMGTPKMGSTDLNRGDFGVHTITITESNVLSIVASDANASEAGTDTGTFTVTRSGAGTGALVVNLAISGTARGGIDYTALPRTLSFAGGETTKTIAVAPINDSIVEPGETVVVGIVAGSGYAVGAQSSAAVTIADDDGALPIVATNAQK